MRTDPKLAATRLDRASEARERHGMSNEDERSAKAEAFVARAELDAAVASEMRHRTRKRVLEKARARERSKRREREESERAMHEKQTRSILSDAAAVAAAKICKERAAEKVRLQQLKAALALEVAEEQRITHVEKMRRKAHELQIKTTDRIASRAQHERYQRALKREAGEREKLVRAQRDGALEETRQQREKAERRTRRLARQKRREMDEIRRREAEEQEWNIKLRLAQFQEQRRKAELVGGRVTLSSKGSYKKSVEKRGLGNPSLKKSDICHIHSISAVDQRIDARSFEGLSSVFSTSTVGTEQQIQPKKQEHKGLMLRQRSHDLVATQDATSITSAGSFGPGAASVARRTHVPQHPPGRGRTVPFDSRRSLNQQPQRPNVDDNGNIEDNADVSNQDGFGTTGEVAFVVRDEPMSSVMPPEAFVISSSTVASGKSEDSLFEYARAVVKQSTVSEDGDRSNAGRSNCNGVDLDGDFSAYNNNRNARFSSRSDSARTQYQGSSLPRERIEAPLPGSPDRHTHSKSGGSQIYKQRRVHRQLSKQRRLECRGRIASHHDLRHGYESDVKAPGRRRLRPAPSRQAPIALGSLEECVFSLACNSLLVALPC